MARNPREKWLDALRWAGERRYIHDLPIGSEFQYQPHGPAHTLLKLKGTRATETCSPGCTSTLPSNTLVIPL